MTFREGDKMLSQAVAVNPTDVAAFKQLLDKGVELSLNKWRAAQNQCSRAKSLMRFNFNYEDNSL